MEVYGEKDLNMAELPLPCWITKGVSETEPVTNMGGFSRYF
jgi:hypothetical protein